jgi:prophage regulatory protein
MNRNKKQSRQLVDHACACPPYTDAHLCPELKEILKRVRNIVNDHVLRLPQVSKKTGRAPATIWKDVSDRIFPPPFPIGERAVGWLESEIDAVIEARVFSSRTAQPLDMQMFVALLTAPKRAGDQYGCAN